MNSFLIIGLGLIAQGLFAARFVVQLLKSEKANRVVSPALFWQLSLIASFLLIVYGFFRNDIVIVGGQLVGYLIYIRNLQLKGEWSILPKWVRASAFVLPALFLVFLAFGIEYNWDHLLDNPEIEGMLLTWGTIGQVIFTSRFVVQWLYSEKKNESLFPVSFWYISTVGSLIIAVYAIFRQDAVLFIGQAFGMIVYFRNLYLHHKPHFKRPMSLLMKFKPYRFPALMVFTAMVLFFNLGNWEVTESSEARYAQIGKEMMESGDYMHPTLMGIYHYHKPPMTYWITAWAYEIFGVSSWSARFFLQLAVLLQIGLVYLIGQKIFREDKKAFYSAMLYAAFPTVIISGRALTTDAYLAVFVLAAIYFWLAFIQERKNFQLILFYLMLGLGFLTKGPVVLIVPIVLIIFQKIFQKERLGPIGVHLLGITLFLVVGLAWFILLFLEDRQFLDYFVFKHTVERFASNTFKRSQPFWFYFAVVIGTAFPWMLMIVGKAKSILSTSSAFTKVLLAWVIVPLVFFSISKSKLILYILPVYPGIAFLSIALWMGLSAKSQLKWDRVQFYFQMLLLSAAAMAPLIEPKLVLSYKFYFVIVITASVLISLRAIPLKVIDRTVFSAYLFFMGITAASTYFFGNNAAIVNDPKNVAAYLNEELKESSYLAIYNRRMPSMSFLTEKEIISLYDGDEGLNRETQFEKDDSWKKKLVNLKEDASWMYIIDEKAVLMVRKKDVEKEILVPARQILKDSLEIDGWVLFFNAKQSNP